MSSLGRKYSETSRGAGPTALGLLPDVRAGVGTSVDTLTLALPTHALDQSLRPRPEGRASVDVAFVLVR